MLAHELRNPLAPIRTGLQVLRLQPGRGGRRAHARDDGPAGRAHGAADRRPAGRLARQPRQDRAQEGAGSISRPIVGTRGGDQPAADRGRPPRAVGATSPPEPLPVEADPTRLAQVFSNLLNNAAKYTPDGRPPRAGRAARGHAGASSRSPTTASASRAEMLPQGVRDVLAGAAAISIARRAGSGIGLTLVRRLTEMHGGTVTADSHGTGHGSTFTVRIPLARAARRRPHAAVPEHRAGEPGAGPRCACCRRRQRRRRADAGAAGADARPRDRARPQRPEALAAIARFRPQVAFVDIGLPGLNGYEVARRVRARSATRTARR